MENLCITISVLLSVSMIVKLIHKKVLDLRHVILPWKKQQQQIVVATQWLIELLHIMAQNLQLAGRRG